MHEQSLKLLTEADDNARHISGVCYKHYVQDLSAKQMLTEIHDLALDFFTIYGEGRSDGYKDLQKNAWDLFNTKTINNQILKIGYSLRLD